MRKHDARAYADASAKHDAPAHATYVRTNVLTKMHSPNSDLLRNATRAGGQNESSNFPVPSPYESEKRMIQPAQSAPSGSRVWDRAVEAAAKARFEDTFSDPDDPKWDEIDAAERQGWLDVMRVALAAGLPLLLDDLAERIEAWADERAAMAERHATDRELSRDFESESDGAMLVARLVRSYAGEVQR